MMNKQALKGELLLVLTALIWGVAFVAQSEGMRFLGPFSFNAIRTAIGCVTLAPLALFSARNRDASKQGGGRKALLIGGLCCGLCLCAASNLQQVGIAHTTVGKAGFITALYILIVPLLGLLMGKKLRALFFAAVGIATLGMYLLTMQGALALAHGDMLVLLSALVFACHILVIDHFSPKCDPLWLSLTQFAVSGALTLILALALERITWTAIRGALVPLLYAGVLSTGAGYTLQVVAQKHVNPVLASLTMSLESVFAALSGWLILGQSMTPRQLLGSALVFVAIVLAQLPDRR